MTALRVFLVALFGILVMLETFSIPGQYAHMAQQNPDEAHLRWPSTIVSIFWIVCVQVVIVATWKLLTLVRKDLIFTEGAIKWVNVMVWAIAAAWAVLVGVFIWIGVNADDPGVIVLFFLFTSAVSVVGLVLVVMRALLKRATELRADMESVI
ncbi:membrane protein [Lentzea pudingi]|uniref:Membrane protein n=1 Tax=Lentzea pudingi TaxID=1789439 RepID=A0ABQ2HJN8_9PSEU|nr:membrane protein [Lentzea pudingi]